MPATTDINVHRICRYNTIAASHHDPRPNRAHLYLHIDINCFYAQVEQQSYDLFGIPVIIGGWRKPNGTPRGIVATSSYEARLCGIKTGMSHLEATQRCPFVVPLQVHYEKYQAISAQISALLNRFSPAVEPYSLDESFLDLSFLCGKSRGEIEAYARMIRDTLYREIRLHASVGVSFCKTYAKVASDLKKPAGLVLILSPEDVAARIDPLPLKAIWGIGQKRFERLIEAGLSTIGDARTQGEGIFTRLFGPHFGPLLFSSVTGNERARVLDTAMDSPKNLTFMHTFSDATEDPLRVYGEIAKAVRQLGHRMRAYGKRAQRFGAYIRFQDETWRGVEFEFTTPGLTHIDDYILEACLIGARPLLDHYLSAGCQIRGIGLNTLDLSAAHQFELFFREDEKLSNLYQAIDHIHNRHGLDSLVKASLKYDVLGKTHFLERNRESLKIMC
jgi:DNA polymerase-4